MLEVTIGSLLVVKDVHRPKLWVEDWKDPGREEFVGEMPSWVKGSTRKGGQSFRDFWVCTPEIEELYLDLREDINSQDIQIFYLISFLDSILNLKDETFIAENRERLQWLKYWGNRAVQTYGGGSAIMFQDIPDA